MTAKQAIAELKRCDLENMMLRLDIEQRAVGFMGQMQDVLGTVDSLFESDDVRTLAEAKNKWHKFRAALDETQNLDMALEAIDRISVADDEENASVLVELWSRGK